LSLKTDEYISNEDDINISENFNFLKKNNIEDFGFAEENLNKNS
jgi:hypothetical protein